MSRNKSTDSVSRAFKLMSSVVNDVQELSNCLQTPMARSYYGGDNGTVAGGYVGMSNTFSDNLSAQQYSFTLPPIQTNFGSYPKIDVLETKEAPDPDHTGSYLVEIFAAGVDRKAIQVELKEGYSDDTCGFPPSMTVTIEAHESIMEDGEKYFFKESTQTRQQRIVTLPVDADVRSVTQAEYVDGVLYFQIGKKSTEKTKPATIKLRIK